MQEPRYMRAPRHRTTRAFAAATFGLRLALRLFEKTKNDVTPTSTISNPLLHVCPSRAAKPSTYCSYLCVYDRWAQQVVGPPIMQPKAGAVKAPELSPRGRGRCSNQISRSCTSWRDTSKHCTRYKSFYTFQMDYNIRMYVDIFCFVCSHLLQSLKRLIFGNGGSTTHACMPWLSFWYLHVLIWCTLPNFDYKFN